MGVRNLQRRESSVMAKTIDRELFDKLRAQGLRKRVARLVSEAAGAGRSASARGDAAARNVIAELRKAADEIEDRLRGGASGSRSEAAKKAARTRTTNANKRSAAAKKAAATRARKSSGNGSTRSSGGTSRRTSSGS